MAPGRAELTYQLGGYADAVAEALRRIEREDVVGRMWRGDGSVWQGDPAFAASRLGWLDLPATMRRRLPEIEGFAREVGRGGYERLALLGMGGSSRSAATMVGCLGGRAESPALEVVDTTIPGAVVEGARRLVRPGTLVCVASKSGTTIETLSLYRYFRDAFDQEFGREAAAGHFVVLTDAGSPLESLAREERVRRVFIDPDGVGGRYSALSFFGLLPARLAGVDVESLLARAEVMAASCGAGVQLAAHASAKLGAALGALAAQGRDKLTIHLAPTLSPFGAWLDQLIAESSGKDGAGIVPVIGEAVYPTPWYGDDRAFLFVRVDGDEDEGLDAAAAELAAGGHPVISLRMRDPRDIGGEFFRWEFATAIVCRVLGVNPFDQPDVQASKRRALRALRAPDATQRAARDTGRPNSLDDLLALARPGDFLAVMAYVAPSPRTDRALADLRRSVTRIHGIAVTVGYGPGLLHSAGQLHKGGPNSGLFLQIVEGHASDAAVPGMGYTFGELADAQSMGDFLALRALGNRVARVRSDALPGLV